MYLWCNKLLTARNNPSPFPSANILLDTNVWLDWLIFQDPNVESIRALHTQGSMTLIRNAAVREELIEVIERPIFRQKLPSQSAVDEMIRIYDSLTRDVITAAADAVPLKCSDPADQKFLELAWQVPGVFLITKDKQLLKLARRASRLGEIVGDRGTPTPRLSICHPSQAPWRPL